MSDPPHEQKPLWQELDLMPHQQATLLDAPEGYAALLEPLPEGVQFHRELHEESGFIQYFASNREDLRRMFPELKQALVEDGVLWVAWPKDTSDLETDVTEESVRAVGLAVGLVDVKMCSVGDAWSALKFVNRKKDGE